MVVPLLIDKFSFKMDVLKLSSTIKVAWNNFYRIKWFCSHIVLRRITFPTNQHWMDSGRLKKVMILHVKESVPKCIIPESQKYVISEFQGIFSRWYVFDWVPLQPFWWIKFKIIMRGVVTTPYYWQSTNTNLYILKSIYQCQLTIITVLPVFL